MNSTPSQRLKKARIALRMDEPFCGSLMMQLRPVEDAGVPTFRTDGRTLWYNPAYLDTLDDGQLRTVLAHEVMHPALLHPFRIGDRDLKVANRAADYAINNFLDTYNQQAQSRGEPAPFPWPMKDGKPDVLIDHAYDGKSFEEIYADLMRQPPAAGGDQPNPVGTRCPSSPTSAPSPIANQQSQIGNSPAGQGEVSNPGQPGEPSYPGEFCAASPDSSENQAMEAQWKVALKQAATMAKSQGRLPGGMDRLIDELLDPRASWREILGNLLTAVAKDDYTWSRPNTRYGGRGVILPSLHSPRLGRVAVAIDTSGSIGQEELNFFMAEIRAILFDCRPEKMIIAQCDAKIHEWTEIDPFDEVDVQLKGGGGTNFCPVFERLALEPDPPAALVYLTDLEGTFPDEPDRPAYPVIWATINDKTAPFGETVLISI